MTWCAISACRRAPTRSELPSGVVFSTRTRIRATLYGPGSVATVRVTVPEIGSLVRRRKPAVPTASTSVPPGSVNDTSRGNR